MIEATSGPFEMLDDTGKEAARFEARAAVTAYLAEAGDEWMPIETAPKDGTTVLLWSKYHDEPVTAGFGNSRWRGLWDGCSVIQSQGDTWTDYKLVDVPTHWRPLPKAPEGTLND